MEGPPDPATIDWEALYRRRGASGEPGCEKEAAGFWDERAPDFGRKAHHPEQRRIAEELLDRFGWRPDERVLDVGAGPGTLTLPLARRVREVTAFDLSAVMLEQLRQRMVHEGVTNIQVRQGRWLDAPDEAVTGFDTVVCANALGPAALTADGDCEMGRAVARLRAAARRGLVLVPHADQPADAPMREAVGLPEPADRRERVALLYHIFVRQGLLPDLTILQRPFFWSFRDLDEGVVVLGRRLRVADDPGRLARLRAHLGPRLEPDRDGHGFTLRYPVAQALFTWGV